MRSRRDFLIAGSGAALASASAALAAAKPYPPNSAGSGIFTHLYGDRKPSYEVLRTGASPVESITVPGDTDNFTVTVAARKTIPAYTLVSYKLRGIFYNEAAIPVERVEAELPPVPPGERRTVNMAFTLKEPWQLQFDVLRPTGFSPFTQNWLQ